MSIWGDLSDTVSDAWHGSSNMIGDVAGMGMEGIDKMVGVVAGDEHKDEADAADGLLPSGEEAKNFVNHTILGNDDEEEEAKTGNTGNEIGTIVGGLGGLIGGPGGVAAGAALGSEVGGWISDLF